MSFDSIIAGIEGNAARDGFEAKEIEGFDRVWHRRKFMLSRVGLVDAVVTIRVAESVTELDLVRHEDDAFVVALGVKTWLPRGLGSAVEVHPITLAGNADADAITYAGGSMRNRWSAMTMHALIHGNPPQTVVFEGGKVWGAAYVGSVRSQLKALVG